MIDKWFKKDIEEILIDHPVAVFIDSSKEAKFLLNEIKSDFNVYEIDSEIEELRVKYEIEKNRDELGRVIIYTTIPKDKLTFIREYCETNGNVEINYLQNYIKEKIHNNLNINLLLEKDELISAAKVSLGKDNSYWLDLGHKGASEIFNLEKELLPFLADPKGLVKKYDKETQLIFFKKVNELIGQSYIEKPAKTLANEVVEKLFDGLLNNNPNNTLLNLYYTWLDSKSYQDSLLEYVSSYDPKMPSDIFSVHSDHPFDSVDQLWLSNIGENIFDREYIQKVLLIVKKRNQSLAVKNLKKSIWGSLIDLLAFDKENIHQLTSLDQCAEFYVSEFSKVDNAIRKMYAQFLDEEDVIRPYQDYYTELLNQLLAQWFKYTDKYSSNQTGKLQEIINSNEEKTAIIVGDGVAFEYARDITLRVSNNYKLENSKSYIYAGLPSETEHNMSQLYIDSGEVINPKKKREEYLSSTNQEKEIGFIDLGKVTESSSTSHYLICSDKDPDKLGETYQQKALQHFDAVADRYAQKIDQLFKNGYQHVYLVTDHGYVLTGILEDSDKIEVQLSGSNEKSERYMRTKDVQKIDDELLVQKEVKYKSFNYCYFAKRLGPFKTPGVYGFSHGGLSPQETITPFFHWTNKDRDLNQLSVKISNSHDLKNLPSDIFPIRLKGESLTNDLFNTSRKVVIILFHKGEKLSETDTLDITSGKELKKEFNFNGMKAIEVKVLDALTRSTLDKVNVTKDESRDLGGL